jgi:hypothetical protein
MPGIFFNGWFTDAVKGVWQKPKVLQNPLPQMIWQSESFREKRIIPWA